MFNQLRRWRLRIWAFIQLGKVDKNLQTMAIEALQSKWGDSLSLPPLDNNLQKQIRHRVASLNWASRYHPCHPRCLHRSMVIYNWLVSQGVHPQLQIGWGEDIGHAWVKYGDQILNDRADIEQLTPPLLKPNA